jgi:hypothetical protein
MTIEAAATQGQSPCSPAQALAMKNAALKAVLGYLELKSKPGEWPADEVALRYRRLVELALKAPCELESGEKPRFEVKDLRWEKPS